MPEKFTGYMYELVLFHVEIHYDGVTDGVTKRVLLVMRDQGGVQPQRYPITPPAEAFTGLEICAHISMICVQSRS